MNSCQILSFLTNYFEPLDSSSPLSEANSRGSLFVAGPVHIDASVTDEDTDDLYTELPTQLLRAQTMATGKFKTSSSMILKNPSREDVWADGESEKGSEISESVRSGVGKKEKLVITINEVTEVIQAALQAPMEKVRIQLPEMLLDESKIDETLKNRPAQWVRPQIEKAQRITNELYNGKEPEPQYVKAEPLEEPEEPDKGRLWLPTPDLGQESFITDPETGVTLGRLSNGIRLNYKKTNFEPNRCSIRVFFTGGRMIEPSLGLKPQLLNLGIKSLLDGGLANIPQHIVARMTSMWGLDVKGSVDCDVGLKTLWDWDIPILIGTYLY